MRRVLEFPITRIVLFLVVFGVVTTLGVMGLQALVGKEAWVDIVPASVASVVGVLLLRLIERRPLRELGFRTDRLGHEALVGFGLGALLQCLVFGLLALQGHYVVSAFNTAAFFNVAKWAGLFAMAALTEEILFRAVIFRITQQSLGSVLSLGVSALIFGLVHLGNANASLWAGLAIALEAGVLLGAAYLVTDSLWLAWGLHWAWNLFQGPIFGGAVSGTDTGASLLTAKLDGPALWTGGAFGPEAGLATVLLCTAAGGLLLWHAVRHRGLTPPFWRRPKPATAITA